MPPLDRACALVQIKDIAVLVAEDLDLDMARVQDEFLDENAIVAEAVEAFALDALEPLADVLFVIGKAHALAAAAGGRLHHHRIADLVRSEEHPSELPSLMRTSYAVFCLQKK